MADVFADQKKFEPEADGGDVEGGIVSGGDGGHLKELEVDVGQVLKEEGELDFSADHSPFPEGEA